MITILETKSVGVKTLKPFHKNPNVGDIDRIAKSLVTIGQFKPIVVNVGSITKRKNEILAGNHTWLAARRLGWSEIVVSYVDVDEETAAAIVINDNDAARAGTYDWSVYGDLIDSLPDLTTLTLSQTEIDDVLASAMKSAEQAARALTKQQDDDEPDDGDTPERARQGTQEPAGDDEEPDLDRKTAESRLRLQGTLEAKENLLWKGNNAFEIPDLREDMLMSLADWPETIVTWAGYEWLSQHSPDDGKRWYFYNYGIVGRKGLPLDRSILAFNTHDHKFAQWWDYPAHTASELIAQGLRYAVVPDYSFYEGTPRFEHLYGVYKAQWLGRFLQEAGVRVIPRVQFQDEKSLDYCMIGIPKNPPLLHVSVQNIANGKDDRARDMALIKKCIQACVDELDPVEGLIVYGGNPARTILGKIKLPKGVKPIWIENYASVRRGSVYDKGRKGINTLIKPKDRKRIMAEAAEQERARLGDEVVADQEPDYDEE